MHLPLFSLLALCITGLFNLYLNPIKFSKSDSYSNLNRSSSTIDYFFLASCIQASALDVTSADSTPIEAETTKSSADTTATSKLLKSKLRN